MKQKPKKETLFWTNRYIFFKLTLVNRALRNDCSKPDQTVIGISKIWLKLRRCFTVETNNPTDRWSIAERDSTDEKNAHVLSSMNVEKQTSTSCAPLLQKNDNSHDRTQTDADVNYAKNIDLFIGDFRNDFVIWGPSIITVFRSILLMASWTW